MGIEHEGSLSFRVRHQDKDWATNNKPYEFPPVQAGKIRATFVKHPTHKIEIRVAGPLGVELVFEGMIPPVQPDGLTVAVTWTAQEVKLYLDGKTFKTVAMSDHKLPGNGGKTGTARPAPPPRPSDA
jgi:hypothetical protein